MELVVGMSRRGHPALPQGSFRNSRPLQLERKQPCFRALSYCLSACRAANEKSTRTMGDHNEHGRLATGQAGCPVSCWQGQISSHFLFATPASREMSRQGALEGCTVQSLPPSEESWPMMGITGLSEGRDLPAGS